MKRIWIGLIALAFGGCASAAPLVESAPGGGDMAKLGPPQQSDDLTAGGRYKEPWLSAAVKGAAAHSLGSLENPVRADMPEGQHAYLKRLRCADGKAPRYARAGNLGFGVFGSIIDAYDVSCPGSSPAKSTIIMDMYFPGHVETRAVAGFTITP